MTTFRADIQGLRAVAVILVLVYHAGASLLAGGFVGVDVFFVVSGFFLTTHLVQRLDLSGSVGLGEFYARRARRLLPASMLVALLTLVAGFLWMPPIQFENNVRPAIASILQVPNVLFAREGTNYLAVETPSAFQHYWTLGVEWQFFAVWPLVLWGLWRITRSRRALVLSVSALTAMSFAGSVWLTGYRQPWAFFMLPPRAWEFGAGALVAFALLKGRTPIGERLAAVTGWAGLAAIVGSALVFDARTVFPGVAAAVPALGASAVLLSGGVPSRWGPTSLLSTRPAQFLGNISFSVYLVHWPLLIITQPGWATTVHSPFGRCSHCAPQASRWAGCSTSTPRRRPWLCQLEVAPPGRPVTHVPRHHTAVLEPRSRRPKESPTRVSEEVKAQAVAVRAALESSGLDHGPISVHDKMKAMGLQTVPSTAALSRIFREAGVARAEPRKKPRAAWRRFVYPAPNACWQLDATEYVLTGGGNATIFQLVDDHSRVAVGSHVAWGETSEAAIIVFDKAVAAYGVPRRLLSDNGVALNPTRRGYDGQLVAHLRKLGVEPITGKPGKPTTQGKNERFHQTLFRWLDKQPLAETLDELQAQVDEFDRIYNTQRPPPGAARADHPGRRLGSHTHRGPAPPGRAAPHAHAIAHADADAGDDGGADAGDDDGGDGTGEAASTGRR